MKRNHYYTFNLSHPWVYRHPFLQHPLSHFKKSIWQCGKKQEFGLDLHCLRTEHNTGRHGG